jgi:molybdate transport system substrate-binding protein
MASLNVKLDSFVQRNSSLRYPADAVALSPISLVVRAGAKVPNIQTVVALRQTLLAAKSVAYSDSASGVYLETTLLKRLDIADQMKGKAHQISATPVAEIVAKGQAEIGFQEVSELLPVPGVTFVGPLPPEVQHLTPFAAAVVTLSRHRPTGRGRSSLCQGASGSRKNGLEGGCAGMCQATPSQVTAPTNSPGEFSHAYQRDRQPDLP